MLLTTRYSLLVTRIVRVISGSAKGRRLKLVPGDSTRPIMDRAKENLFNILGQFVRGSRWLDLFAGTGQVGIEALSRGADGVVFTDKVRPAINTIQQNLKATRLTDKATVLLTDAFAYLKRSGNAPFDVIYIAPPQYVGLWVTALQDVDQNPALLTADGIAIVQIDPKEYELVELQNLTLYDKRKYGNTMFCFYEQIIA